MLTSKEIVDSGIVSNYVDEGVQQQGIDLRIDRVFKLTGVGAVPEEGKTVLPELTEMPTLRYTGQGKFNGAIQGWMLSPGVYDIVMKEGIDVPFNKACMLKTRSSLVRQGVNVESGLFDAGFTSTCLGAMLYVTRSIIIARGARVAQLLVFESNEVDNTYDGQFQGDSQREDQILK